MIVVDHKRYGPSELKTFQERMLKLDPLNSPEGRFIALCLDDPFETIGMVLLLREQGGNVLLLPRQTPYETAYQYAVDAGCHVLLYGNAHRIIQLETDVPASGEPGVCQFSSGTTGKPKLIQRTWREVDIEVTRYNERLEAKSDETPLVWVPVTHSFGLISGVLSSLARGAEPVVLTDRNPKGWLGAVKQHPRSIVFAVPFQLHLALAFKPPTRFHRVVSSGSPLTEDLLVRLQEVSGEVLQQYGCSELGCITLARQPLGPADIGTLLPHIALEQVGTPDQPVEWTFLSGERRVQPHDIGYERADGRLHLLGRTDDVINVSGQKVFPYEVEQVLLRHPHIRDAVVFRTQHKIWGEAVKALIVMDADADTHRQEEQSDMEAVLGWCQDYLPPYKVPSVIEQVDQIPRSVTGKVSRKQLAKLTS